MWRTPEDNRVLKGHEAALFKAGLSSLVDWIEDDDDWAVEVPVFDQLSKTEKFGILEHIASALLLEEVPCPPHTAVAESAIAAVFAQLMINVDLQIDGTPGDERSLIFQACRDCDLAEDVPPSNSNDSDAWHEILELLGDRILWDRDWAEELIRPDQDPDEANKIREFRRIDVDYYSAAAPDPSPSQLTRIRARIRSLCMD